MNLHLPLIVTLALSTCAACPIPEVTPGAAFPTVTVASLCKPGYSATVRNVSDAAKRRVCAAYGITSGCPGPGYEIDHLISLELGGSNDERNLWPQPIAEARVKDKLENRLHRQVCHGKTRLTDAQSLVKECTAWNYATSPATENPTQPALLTSK